MSGIWVADIADHLPIYITLPYSAENVKHKDKIITKRIYSQENIDAFKNELCNYDWTNILIEEGTNNKYDRFLHVITQLHNIHFPLISMKITRKTETKPWISKTLVNSIKKKNTMYKNYLKSKSDILLKKYKTYKNKLQTIIRQAEKHYYSTKIEEHRDNISKTWKIMNSVINKNQVKKH